MLKICRCCDTILGELEAEGLSSLKKDYSIEVVGNIAYTLCPQCMRELDRGMSHYYQ